MAQGAQPKKTGNQVFQEFQVLFSRGSFVEIKVVEEWSTKPNTGVKVSCTEATDCTTADGGAEDGSRGAGGEF